MRMRRKKWTEPVLGSCGFLINDPKSQKGRWRDSFDEPDRPLMLEIGCGKGVSTVRMAHENSGVNYIAVDQVRHVLAVTVKNAMSEFGDDPIGNLRLACVDAERCYDSFSPEDGISRIYISFPNPWNEKAKHHKKRLTHPRQLLQYRGFLAENGEIYLKTDDRPLFEASKRYLGECGFDISYETTDLHSSGFEPNYVSEHEKLYSEAGKHICFLIAVMRGLPENYVMSTEGRPFEMAASHGPDADKLSSTDKEDRE